MKKIKVLSALSLLAFSFLGLISCGGGSTDGGIVEKPDEKPGEKPSEECVHSWNEANRVDATCLEDGRIDYVCVHCGEQKQEGLSHFGHNYGSWVTVVEPTEETEGQRKQTCSNCGDEITETIEKLEHVHNYSYTTVEETCTTDGYKIYTCECGDTYNDNFVPAYGHLEDIDAAVPATCTTDGLTEGKHCRTCQEVLVAQEVIPAGHSEVIDEAKEATCEVDGLTEGKHCDVCKEVLVAQEVIPALGHNYVEGVCGNCNGDYYTQALTFYTYSSYAIVTGLGETTETDIIIPATYKGVPVTNIGWGAFENNTSITSVSLPTSVSYIDTDAFMGCSNLKTINLPEGLEYIGTRAFQNSGLTGTLEIPSSVTTIENMAFSGCNNITYVTINEGLSELKSSSFGNMKNLKIVSIPVSITKMTYPFGSTENLSTVYYGGTLEDWLNIEIVSGGPLYYAKYLFYADNAGTITYNEKNYSLLTDLVVPSSVTAIGAYQFNGYKSLNTVVLHEGVTSIGENAFKGCSGLVSFTIQSAIEGVADASSYSGLFYECRNLKEVYNTSSLVIEKGSNTFGGVAANALVVHNSLDEPSIVSRSGDYVFYQDVETSEYFLFAYNGLSTTVVLPDDINGSSYRIAPYTFYNMKYLTSVKLSDGVISVGREAFAYCSGIKELDLGNSLETVGQWSFNYCSGITRLTIPASLTSFGFEGFVNCFRLVEIINLSSKVLEPGSTNHGDVAQWAKVIHTSPNEPSIISNDGSFIFARFDDSYHLIDYVGFNKNIELPETYNGETYSIHDFAFIKIEDVETIVVPNGIKNIGQSAFREMPSLRSVRLPEDLETLGQLAFYECDKLTSIVIPDSVTEIGLRTFNGCDSLTSVDLGNGLVSIGDYAFGYCKALKEFYIPSTLTTVGNNVFSNVYYIENVYYAGSEEQWATITFGKWENNALTTNSTITYNYIRA